MLIVKLMKYKPNNGGCPTATAGVTIREASAVHVRYVEDESLRTILQLGDAPGDTTEVSIGDREDCSYNVAYIMNASGKTVETIR